MRPGYFVMFVTLFKFTGWLQRILLEAFMSVQWMRTCCSFLWRKKVKIILAPLSPLRPLMLYLLHKVGQGRVRPGWRAALTAVAPSCDWPLCRPSGPSCCTCYTRWGPGSVRPGWRAVLTAVAPHVTGCVSVAPQAPHAVPATQSGGGAVCGRAGGLRWWL